MNYTFIIFVYILFHNKMQLQSYEKVKYMTKI